MPTTKYITRQDYKDFTGIDLQLELKDNDDASNKVEIFISNIENWCESHIQYATGQKINFTTLETDSLQHFKKGILYQLQYVIRNGDVTTDSGYNPESGPIVEPNFLQAISLAPNAKMEFMLAGLYTRKLRPNYGYKYEDIY
jgi:hypothetical protein